MIDKDGDPGSVAGNNMIINVHRVKHLVSQADTPEEAEQIIDDYEATLQEPEQD